MTMMTLERMMAWEACLKRLDRQGVRRVWLDRDTLGELKYAWMETSRRTPVPWTWVTYFRRIRLLERTRPHD